MNDPPTQDLEAGSNNLLSPFMVQCIDWAQLGGSGVCVVVAGGGGGLSYSYRWRVADVKVIPRLDGAEYPKQHPH